MDSNTQFIIGTALAVLSIVYSWFVFRKGKQKMELTPYLQFHSRIFSGLDPELIQDLIIKYKEQPVENLHQLQFIIANTGNKPIQDIIEPLQLVIPKEYEILDAKIIEVLPKGRKIQIQIEKKENFIQFKILLLNKDELFKVKLLLGCELNDTELLSKTYFKITSPELKPILSFQTAPKNLYDPSPTSLISIIFSAIIVFLFINLSEYLFGKITGGFPLVFLLISTLTSFVVIAALLQLLWNWPKFRKPLFRAFNTDIKKQP